MMREEGRKLLQVQVNQKFIKVIMDFSFRDATLNERINKCEMQKVTVDILPCNFKSNL